LRRNRLPIIGIVLILAGLIISANLGQFSTLGYVQRQGAQHRALDEAKNVAATVPGIKELVQTGFPDVTQMASLKAVTLHGNVSAILFYDNRGQKVLAYGGAIWMMEPDIAASRDRSISKVLASGTVQSSAEHTFGSETLPYLFGAGFLPVLDENGRILGVVAVYLDLSDIAELFDSEFVKLSAMLSVLFSIVIVALSAGYLLWRRRARQSGRQVDYLARYDQLTGLCSRSGFHALFREMHRKGSLDPARTAVFYFDLDNFKSINDTRGHRAGDDILRHAGTVIREYLRPNDMASRFGGDEFVVIAETGTLAAAVDYAERLQALMMQQVQSGDMILTAGVSCGIRFGIDDETRIDDDIHRADLALYVAKTDGGNTCRVFSAELESRANRRLKIENAVNRGLENDLFSLQYQPLIDRESGRCIGFEALLRLTDGDGESISPTEFVPIAEANGAIRKIGAWVLSTAAAEAVTWPTDLFVSVNLSARQFDDENLIATVRATLEQHRLEPHRLELEVTESQLIENGDSVGGQLMALHALDVSISMDDFGTGYSSLGYLWKYDFDKLKIDRSFILGLDADTDRAREILDTIIVLGHRLNMKVIAEGIETETQARLLAELSFDQFQGYLFGVPMSPGDLPGFLLKNSLEPWAAAGFGLDRAYAGSAY